MIHTWIAQKGDCRGELPYAELTYKAGSAAQSVLTQNWDFVLRDTSSEEMSKKKLVKNLVMQYCRGILQRAGEDLKARCQSIPGVELTPPMLYGWDYMDLVMGKHSSRKQIQFDGNWRDLAEDVMVLFGQKFGDVIKPAPNISICGEWNPIPAKRMFWTATVDCLRQLSWERGGHRDSLVSSRLTNKAYWNCRTQGLFTDCTNCIKSTGMSSPRCSKKPQNLDSSAKNDHFLVPPSEGAIVFGCTPKLLHKNVPVKIQTGKID